MQFDLEEAVFSQAQVAECTSADPRTVENYINYGYLVPSKIDGRRRFTGFDLIETEFLFRLAGFGIAPRGGVQLVKLIMYKDQHALQGDASSVDQSPSWPARATRRVQLEIIREEDGGARLVREDEENPESITFIFPSQLFARVVLQRADAVLKDRG